MNTSSGLKSPRSRDGWPCLVVAAFLGTAGCGEIDSLVGLATAPTGLAGEVAQKASAIAARIGGPDGFGGERMDGYRGRMPMHMGFHDDGALASSEGVMTVRMSNEAGQDCVFHLSYVSSRMGATEQTMDVAVAAGGEVSVQMPCFEIMGMGPMEMPGQPGCHLADGQPVDNAMALPGFMGMDYACGGEFMYRMMADANDLDGDGDREELIIMSQAMEQHMQRGFPMGMGSMMGGMMGG